MSVKRSRALRLSDGAERIADKQAIVFAVHDSGNASGSERSGGLSAARRYVETHADGWLSSLSSDTSGISHPRPRSGRALTETYYLRLESEADFAEVRAELKSDSRIRVRRPAFRQLESGRQDTAVTIPGFSADQQWGLAQCRFTDAWAALAVGGVDPGPVALIDMGQPTAHPGLAGCITRCTFPDNPSQSGHAMKVAGILAGRAPSANGRPPYAGCCSGKLHLYNIWSTSKLDRSAYYYALSDVAESGARVLNLSVGSLDRDPEADRLIQKCIKAGVIVIAAMGDYQSNLPVYPAATEGVIAVGATNPRDRHTTNSNFGAHVLIGAPGESILTLHGDRSYKRQDGTSFAAPMVSAAAWLALRHRPEWVQADFIELFRKSVHVPGRGHDPHIGYGRLDMKRLADVVLA